MKKLLLISLFVIGLTIAGTDKADAQIGQFKLGGGLLFGSEVESAGIQGNGTYRFSEDIAGAADISIFFPGDDTGLDSFWSLNVNGHYLFAAEEEYHLYGLGGLNVSTAENSFNNNSDSELGLNLGAGGELHLSSVSLFGEIKYVISDFDQLVLGAGVRVPLN